MSFRFAAAALLGAGLLAGCANPAEPAATPPYPPVPPPMTETVPKPPVTAEPLMWQPGHWDWNGTGYVWAPGQYIPAAGHGSLWVPGWWSRTQAGWKWQAAHWTS
jgi:multidrug efflux pump subunit AcrA (membrane-fusion protein)